MWTSPRLGPTETKKLYSSPAKLELAPAVALAAALLLELAGPPSAEPDWADPGLLALSGQADLMADGTQPPQQAE